MKSIFNRKSTDNQAPPVKKEARRTSLESQKVGANFAEFLKTIPKPAALDISKQVSLWFMNRVPKSHEVLLFVSF